MQNTYSRTEILIGSEALKRLAAARVAVFGIGGVGGHAAESLARCGIGTIDLIDSDRVCLTNLNRQIIALRSQIGRYKVDVAAERINDINPDITVNRHCCFYLPEKKNEFDFEKYDYIIDAIDTVTAKIDIICEADRLHIPIISAMGCGNRIDPSKLKITDLFETSNDPLCRIMRRELRKRNIDRLKVVCSSEDVIRPLKQPDTECPEFCSCPEKNKEKKNPRRDTPGSSPFVPAAAGILIASEVFRELSGFDRNNRSL